MTLEEFYGLAGGDYRSAVSRLMNEKLVLKFLLKFPADDSFSSLKDSLEAGDCKEAFRHVHTLKGVAYNLSLNALGDRASALCEDLRGGNPENAVGLFGLLEESYQTTVELIRRLEAE